MKAIDYYGKFSAQKYWDWWHSLDSDMPVHYIMQLLSNSSSDIGGLTGGMVADLGCGPGNSFPILAKEFGLKDCIAVDGSEGMLTFVKSRPIDSLTVRTQLANLETDRIDVPDLSLDVVISCCTLGYLESIDMVISESARILRSGGYLAFDLWFHEESDRGSIAKDEPGVEVYAFSYTHSMKRIDELMVQAGCHLVGKHDQYVCQSYDGLIMTLSVFLYKKE